MLIQRREVGGGAIRRGVWPAALLISQKLP